MKCAHCKHFDTDEYGKWAALGMGRCAKGPAATFVRWDREQCKKYEPAKDMAVRMEFVAKQGG